jgi:hypothetical protein
MKKSLTVTLITLLPLVVSLNLLLWVRVVDDKLLLAIAFAIIALVPWRYRKELMDWSATRVKEDRGRWRKTHHLQLIIGLICFLGLCVFFCNCNPLQYEEPRQLLRAHLLSKPTVTGCLSCTVLAEDWAVTGT